MIVFINSIFFFRDFPIVVKIVWLLVVFFSISIVVLIFYLRKLRRRLRKHEDSRIRYINQYEVSLVNYLYANEEGKDISKAQKKIIRELKLGLFINYKRKLFVKTLIKLLGEVSGEMTNSMRRLYMELGLLKQAKSKLKHRNWHIVAIGIRDLRMLKIVEVQKDISKHINHPKLEVRRQAHLYFLSVFGYKGLDFLDELKSDISVWDQVGFLEILGKIDDQEMPDVTKWLNSSNDYVILFTLQLVKLHNRIGTKEVLLKLINHQNKEIRLEVIRVLSHFNFIEAKEPLIEVYSTLTGKEQLAVFKLMDKLAVAEDVPFVVQHLHSVIFEIKVLAISILRRINTVKFQEFKLSNEDTSNKEIIRFLESN